MTNSHNYFILSSDCKLVRGTKRSAIIDYQRSDLYFISHDYLELLQKMDRQKLSDIEIEINVDSKDFFDEFLTFVKTREIGFFTDNPEQYPIISEGIVDDYILLKDVIIEIDNEYFNWNSFKRLCRDLDYLGCKYFQIRLLSNFNIGFVNQIICEIAKTSAHYIELHCTYNNEINDAAMYNLVESNALLTQLYIYSAPESKVVQISNEDQNYYPVVHGQVFYISYAFDNGNCCGIITEESLNFTSFHLHNQLKSKNGCLDRKIAINKFGNIKNCPSMPIEYGNIDSTSIKNIIQNEEFRKYWFIHKDQISTCKGCEFRYNCTDCRAFLQDQNDLYSKPLKCGYDPETCTWEDWSKNPLKDIKSYTFS